MEESPISKLKISLDVSKLIQPDLLSCDELVEILREKGIEENILSQDKDKLVSLFKRVALPLPQRELRENYRGSLLKKLRKKAERIKLINSSSTDKVNYTIGVTGNPNLAKNNNEEKDGDRLKPPPDLVNYERKKIRLNSNNSSKGTSSKNHTSDLDNVIIKKRKTSESSSESFTDNDDAKKTKESLVECKESKTNRLKINRHKESSEKLTEKDDIAKEECNGTKTNTVCKKVSLKRNHLISKAPCPVAEVKEEKSPSEPDKKRKLITWP